MMTPGRAAYSVTNGAIKISTQGLSREVGSRSITANNVQPGPIDTDLNPASGDWAAPQKAHTSLNRYGSVEEVAAVVSLRPVQRPRHHPRQSHGRRRNERVLADDT